MISGLWARLLYSMITSGSGSNLANTIRKIFRTSKVLRNDRYRSMFLDNISEGKYMMITDANTDTDTKTDADADAI
jgi:hypothetical protein